MLSVRLPETIAARLNLLADKTSRTKSFYVVEALKRHLEDIEDLYLAEQAHENFILSGEKPLTTEEVEEALDL